MGPAEWWTVFGLGAASALLFRRLFVWLHTQERVESKSDLQRAQDALRPKASRPS